jgi:dUTP pyrophosphatase
MIPAGIYFELPEGFEAQINPGRGPAIRKGISVLNTTGTIDAD